MAAAYEASLEEANEEIARLRAAMKAMQEAFLAEKVELLRRFEDEMTAKEKSYAQQMAAARAEFAQVGLRLCLCLSASVYTV